MGTRGFIGFAVDGQDKIAYNQFDSYPEELGLTTLRFARKLASDPLFEAESRARAQALRAVTEDDRPTDADIERLKQWTATEVGRRSETPTWYQLLRRTQGDPETILAAGIVEDASGFPGDSLFAEWGYVVDFDGDALEVHEGFQRTAHDAGRFAHLDRVDPDYAPVRLIASWPLAGLPTDEVFLATVNADRDA